MKRALVLMSMVCTTTVGAATEFPALADPVKQQMIERFKAQQARLDPDQLFAVPTTPIRAQCPVPESLPYRLAGLFELHADLKVEAEQARSVARKSARGAGLDPDAVPPPVYSNVKIAHLRIPCENGALTGDYAVLLSYDSVVTSQTAIPMGMKIVNGTIKTSSHWERRIETSVVQGAVPEKPRRLEFSLMSTRVESHYDDPQMEQTTRQLEANRPSGLGEPTLTVTYVDGPMMASFAPTLDASIGRGVLGWPKIKFDTVMTSTFITTVDERRKQVETYQGARLQSRMSLRDDKMHGESLSYIDNVFKPLKLRVDQQPGMENAREVTIDGRDLVEMRSCYQEGRLVKMSPCLAD